MLEIEIKSVPTERTSTLHEDDRLLFWVDGLVESLLAGKTDVMAPKFWASQWVEELAEETRTLCQDRSLGRYFRGRVFNSPLASPPTSNEFGPAPVRLSRVGRYSRAGEEVIYLATSPDVVRAEIGSRTGKLFVQEFDLSQLPMRIVSLDGSVTRARGFNHLLTKTEVAERQVDNAQYRASYLVRELCARTEADGLLYPSVRLPGTLSSPVNLVLWDTAASKVVDCAVGDSVRVVE